MTFRSESELEANPELMYSIENVEDIGEYQDCLQDMTHKVKVALQFEAIRCFADLLGLVR